jgi:hypothetical protein
LRYTSAVAAIAAVMLAACDSPPAQQPQESNLVNATQTDQAFPSGTGGNDIITGTAEGETSPAAPTGDVPGSPGSGSQGSGGVQGNQGSAAPANSQ